MIIFVFIKQLFCTHDKKGGQKYDYVTREVTSTCSKCKKITKEKF